jgi:hypothetical protein
MLPNPMNIIGGNLQHARENEERSHPLCTSFSAETLSHFRQGE